MRRGKSTLRLAGRSSSKQSGMVLHVCNLLTLQVSVMLCTAHALFGAVIGRVFEEGQGVRLSQAGINDLWWGERVILLPYFSLVIELPFLPVLLGC